MFGAKVYDGAFALVENAKLAFEIILECWVFGGRNMVAANVEEAGDIQGESQHAVVFERLAGNFHDHMGAARSHGIGKVAPQIGRFGRGVAALEFLDAVVGFDGTKNRGAYPGSVHNGVQHIRGCGFTLGARDAHDVQFAARVAIGNLGRGGHGAAHVGGYDCGGVGGCGGQVGGRG